MPIVHLQLDEMNFIQVQLLMSVVSVIPCFNFVPYFLLGFITLMFRQMETVLNPPVRLLL